MTLIRAQVSFNSDSALPRDSITNVVYFDRVDVPGGPSIDWSALAADIGRVFDAGFTPGTCEIVTRLYDMADAKPRAPKATDIKHAGLHPTSALPREVAICLSFFAGRNLPRQRGRIYLPAALMASPAAIGVRPTTTQMDKVLGLASVANTSLPDIGGVDVKHVVYSPTDGQARQVTTYWVDDEWDTVRSRGLKPTTRRTVVREG